MNHRGNRHDKEISESFFKLLKRERIKKTFSGTRVDVRNYIFDYLEIFKSSKLRHGSGNQMSPAEYENLYFQQCRNVQIIRGDSLTEYFLHKT